MNVWQVYQKLYKFYGPQQWWPVFVPPGGTTPGKRDFLAYRVEHGLTYGIPWPQLKKYRNDFRDPYFEIALGAILTQNVSWKNVAQAIINLYYEKVLTPERIMKLSARGGSALGGKRLENLLRPTRYYAQKAKAVKLFSRWLIDEYRGNILELKRYKLQDTRNKLLEQWGIGKETADSIILYALNLPIFVIDIYTKRLCEKFGVVFKEYDEYREFFESQIRLNPHFKNLSKSLLYQEFHALIVASGQEKHAKL